MPAIKGDMYINTHCNYSQPTLIKLYNENIGGHLTPLQAVGIFNVCIGIRYFCRYFVQVGSIFGISKYRDIRFGILARPL